MWLINTHNGIKGKIPRIDINEYPAVKAHLDKYWSIIKDRADQGDTPYNLRNCAYWEELFKPKIIWGEISDRSKFCLDSKGKYYPEATTFMMTGKDLDILLCFLNSKLAEYIFSLIGTTTGVGTVRWKKFKLEQLYVPLNLNEKIKSEMRNMLSQIVNNKATPIDHYISEDKLDSLIYNIYDLSLEEVQFIEKRAKIIRNVF